MTDELFSKSHVITLMIASLIGVGFGIGWWFSGVAALSSGGTVLMVLGVVIAAGLAGWVLRFGRFAGRLPGGGGREAGPFGRTYGIAVLLMVVAIFAGSRLLTVLDLPQAVPAWVLFVVGVHFVPFAKLFGSTRFLLLAALLCGVGVLAVGLGVAGLGWSWRLVPGFGGAIVLWGTVVAGLLDGQKLAHRSVV
ncbi:hypothetical protein UK23_16595 [Lentzea aerocolonigenes]|uniref:Uncharacterized protein n=1 Tax=Lentzea aerocolonigenes TaxID=68170 RepID=A0A0F0H1A6_LENAE|nr:hypothetical protein [Lentzea aerocolonigenes]KJK48626.1 hypothetical protein UK23_16595 [Lentzea aerocolonigenes]